MKWGKDIVHLEDGRDVTLFVQEHPLFDSAQPRRDITLKPVAVKRKRRVDEFVDNIKKNWER